MFVNKEPPEWKNKKNEKLTDLNSEIYAESESLILSCQQNKWKLTWMVKTV